MTTGQELHPASKITRAQRYKKILKNITLQIRNSAATGDFSDEPPAEAISNIKKVLFI